MARFLVGARSRSDAALERAQRDPAGTFRRIERLHRVLLTISLVTVLGAVAGAHGWLF